MRLEGWDADGWDDAWLEDKGIQIGQGKGMVGGGSDCGLIEFRVDRERIRIC